MSIEYKVQPEWVSPKIDFAILQSEIPGAGLGLFTLDDIPKGFIFMTYGGEVLTKNQIEERYPGDTLAKYAIKVHSNKYLDAARLPNVWSRYINALTDPSFCNAEFVTNTETDDVEIIAVKKIKAGDEIYVYYGEEYNVEQIDPDETEDENVPSGLGRKPIEKSKRRIKRLKRNENAFVPLHMMQGDETEDEDQ